MKPMMATMISLALCSAPMVEAAAEKQSAAGLPPLVNRDLAQVSPALARYASEVLLQDVWQRPGLSARDRSLVTLAVLVARNQAVEMPVQFAQALDNGVTPAELSELITHLAFYAGWGNAMTAVPVARTLFTARQIPVDQLPAARAELLPLNKPAEAAREKLVRESYGDVAPGVVSDTTNVLFLDLWLRPALSPRDRSLITVSALIAAGQVAQVPYHLNRAMDSGLTKTQMSEVLTQLAFYAGWPTVFSALPVVKDVVAKRPA